jgi:hypothetical protein
MKTNLLKPTSHVVRIISALLVFAACGLTTSSLATGPGTADDARCLVVAISIGRSSDPTRKAAGETAMMYFLGRLDGSAPTIDLEKTVLGELGRMSQADLQTESQRCGQILQFRGQAMAGLAKALNQLAAQKSSGQR